MKQKILDILKEKGSGFTVPNAYFDTVNSDVTSQLFCATLPKSTGFSIPENYFDTVENRVILALAEENLPQKKGFSVPDDYFNTVETSILEKLDIPAPKIISSDIPDDYFNTFEDRVFTRLEQENDHQDTKVISLGARLRKVWAPVAIAASLALLLTLSGIFKAKPLSTEGVTVAEIEEVLNGFDSYELAEVFSDVDLAVSETINEEEELLDYLNGTDVESMLLEN